MQLPKTPGPLDRTLAYRQAQLEQRQRQVAEATQKGLQVQAGAVIDRELRVIAKTISQAREADHSPDEISAAIEPLVADVKKLSERTGMDPLQILRAVDVHAGASKDPDRGAAILLALEERQDAGHSLSKAEQNFRDHAYGATTFDRAVLGRF